VTFVGLLGQIRAVDLEMEEGTMLDLGGGLQVRAASNRL